MLSSRTTGECHEDYVALQFGRAGLTVTPEYKDVLSKDLTEIDELLRKYHHYRHARVVDEILSALSLNQDLTRLAGIEMWGGAGAVWEVDLPYPSPRTGETRADDRAFKEAIIRISATMDKLGIGTERSRFIARTFRTWRDRNIYPWDE